MAFKLLLTENQSALSNAIRLGLEDHAFTVISPPLELVQTATASALAGFLLDHKPNLIINTLVHADAPDAASQLVAEACSGYPAPCLHLSSYRVFGVAPNIEADGYEEGDLPAPDDPLGQQLQAAEQAFLAVERALVLRLPWIVAPTGDNLFTRVASRLLGGEPVGVSDACRGCPVTHDEVRRVVLAMVLQMLCGAENWGVIHLHTSDICSEAEFADHVARLLEKEGYTPAPIEVLRNQENPLAPGCGLLKGGRSKNNFGIQPRSWRLGMKALVQEWLVLRGSGE